MRVRISIHGQLAPLFLGLWQAEHYERRAWKRKDVHLMVIGRRKTGDAGWGEGQGQDIVPKGMTLLPPTTPNLPTVTYFLQLHPTFPQLPPSSPTRIFIHQSCYGPMIQSLSKSHTSETYCIGDYAFKM